VGRVVIGIAAIFYGIENSLHTANVPGSPGRTTDAPVDSGAPAHWLSDGRKSCGCRVYILLDQTRIAATYLGMDCAAGRVHLWSDSDRGAVPTHRRQS
jgi:hypothetical protein